MAFGLRLVRHIFLSFFLDTGHCHCHCCTVTQTVTLSLSAPCPQVTVGLKALDIYNNLMHMVLDNGMVLDGNITLCYIIECESVRGDSRGQLHAHTEASAPGHGHNALNALAWGRGWLQLAVCEGTFIIRLVNSTTADQICSSSL